MFVGERVRTVLASSLIISAAGMGAVALSAPPASAISAVTLYVSSGSIATTTCSQTNPCGTIQEGINAGDASTYNGYDVTIDVAAGTYRENITVSAANLNSLTIAGAGASSTTVNGGAAGPVFSISGGTVTLSGLTITNGSGSSSEGGAVINGGTLTITNCTISGNTAGGSSTSYGGAIYNYGGGIININESTLSGNSAAYGGAIANNSGTVNITDSTLSGNTASSDGGVIYNNSTLNIADSTLYGNTATGNGGAISEYLGAANITASTLYGNTAGIGGAIYLPTNSTAKFSASIVAGNTGGNCNGTTVDSGYNLTDDSSCGFSASTDRIVTTGLLLGPLANNGGPTSTILPQSGSPAIGVIPLNITINSVQVCPRIDQRGLASATNVQCNIGAVEGDFQSVSFTSSTPSATVGGTTYTPAATSTSGLAVTITVDSTSSGVCSISSGVVSFLSTGTCTLDANQGGDNNYDVASQVQQSVTVSTAPVAPLRLLAQAPLILASTSGVAGTPLTLTSRGGSGSGALTYRLVSTGTANCTLNGDVLNASDGTCTIQVAKAGDATYLNAISAPTTVTFEVVALATQAPLTLTSTRGVAGTPLTLTSSGGSGSGALTYRLVSTGTANCTLSGITLRAHKAGTCALTLTKAADATYAATRSALTTVSFKAGLSATRVSGFVWLGHTSIVAIVGTGFYNKPTITSNDPRTRAVVIHDHGKVLVVRVTVRRDARTGWHVFTITLANGHSCRVRYVVK